LRRLFAAACILTLLSPLAASAHTETELDAWRTGWQEKAQTGLTVALVDEWRDMALRHRPVPAEATSTDRAQPVASTGMGSGVEQWRPLVAVYFPGEVDTALRIMACESGGNPNAYNPSGASGLMQVMAFWFNHHGGDPFDPDNNLRVAALVRAEQGWGAWVCY
jgi:soluble lytic murein transglycosylase-like protein